MARAARTVVAWTVVQVLVTGASGAIGAELIPRLAAGGRRVRAFGRDPARIVAEGVSEAVRRGVRCRGGACEVDRALVESLLRQGPTVAGDARAVPSPGGVRLYA